MKAGTLQDAVIASNFENCRTAHHYASLARWQGEVPTYCGSEKVTWLAKARV